MKSRKRSILSSFVLLFFFFGSAMAQTCYDPNYGYYQCNQSYNYYPDPTQALVEGALIGIVLGELLNQGYEGNHWNGGGRNWGDHQGGGEYHNGGHQGDGEYNNGGHHH